MRQFYFRLKQFTKITEYFQKSQFFGGGGGGGGGGSPYCILPNVNFKTCIFRWKIKSKPDQFSGGYIYMLETTPEIKITMIYDSAKFRIV